MKPDIVEITHQEIIKIVSSKNLRMNYEISFPIYRILPDEVQLALKVLEKHQMKISLLLEEKSPSKE